jgi:hypothetical protein
VSSDPSARAYGRRAEASAKEDAPGLRSCRYYGGVGSAGYAEETSGTTAVKPWGSTNRVP